MRRLLAVWHLEYQIRYLKRDIHFDELDLAALPQRLAQSHSTLADLRVKLALLNPTSKELYL